MKMETSKSTKTLEPVTMICVGLMVIAVAAAVESGQAALGQNTHMTVAMLAGEMPPAP
ncbi:MAG: hypothetical protein JSU65_04580 [Candidatus Zixiibacteriota bacterium]|nr:MAG: hypothetical protein JSU65_04580 [candidate division Zixibacteria bacterium]